MEQTDNDAADYERLYLAQSAKLLTEHREDLLGGITLIRVIHSEGEPSFECVPYYSWDNREQGYMKVWVFERGTPNIYTS
ncbi:hypothetical protein D3C71_2149350 [compost metagenome]